MLQLRWWEVIIFDRITRSKELHIFKTCNLTQCFKLNFFWQGCRKTIYIVFNRIPTFGLNEQLMTIFICKTIDFIFYRRTISRSCTLNSTIEHRRTIKAFTEQIMHLRTRITHLTRTLFCQWLCCITKAKFLWIFITRLLDHF